MAFPGKDPVIVAGAGPVGGTFALYLAQEGFNVVLIEKCDVLPEDLRASTFHPPTLDMLEKLGLTERLIGLGLIVKKYQYRDRRTGEVAEFDMGNISDLTKHPYRLQCEQWRLNQICVAELEKMPNAKVYFSHGVADVNQDADGVNVIVDTPDGQKTIRGSYVFGADGANSFVRQKSGIEYGGFTYPEKFLVASTPFPFDKFFPQLSAVNYISDPEEWCVLLRCSNMWRVLIPTTPGDTNEKLLSDEFIQDRLQHLAKKKGDYVIGHRTLYNVHQRVASVYRIGRILIGGDAAHINNPLGGMGMNGGIHDAINLAEKFVMVRDGKGDESLFDLYDRQRRITAQNFVQEQTISNKKVMEEKDPEAQRKRQADFMRTAADQKLSRAFLMKTSMINVVREFLRDHLNGTEGVSPVTMKYPFSAIAKRGKLKFPDNKKVALILTFNLETWDMTKDTDKAYYAGGPPILPDVLPGNVADFPNFTWREYGQRVGIWRLFDTFDKLKVPASCTINAKTALIRPDIANAPKERGWEVVAHNYEQGELLTDFAKDPKKEREVIEATLKVYKEFYGKPAKGWLSSSLRGTVNTPGILKEHGLIFYCDIMNDDQPFLIETDHGPIVSTPYTNEINDFTILTRRGHNTDEFRDILKEELSQLLSEAEEQGSGRMMNVGLHPHVAGRAYRVRAVREFLEFAKKQPGVWFTTREELATWYLDTGHKGHIV